MKQRMDSFCKFMWNSETREFLGRGGRSWAEIGIFYMIFYACLAGFFAATIAGFYQTIDEINPSLQGDSSLLKGNPGMGYKPRDDENLETTLIYVTNHTKGVNEAYIKSINATIAKYITAAADGVDCSQINSTRLKADKPCLVSYEELTKECNVENYFGFLDGKPCILLKLNRIYGWIPQVWDASEVANVKAIPESIKSRYTSDRIWIDCHGENPADNDNLGLDTVQYFPMQGFPLAFYPYQKQNDYRSPLVFVKFNNVSHHLGLMIECKALAKNIVVDRSEKEGSVHFEMLIDGHFGKSGVSSVIPSLKAMIVMCVITRYLF
jgi:sodium/potassium-transporting ATPase subunit beta